MRFYQGLGLLHQAPQKLSGSPKPAEIAAVQYKKFPVRKRLIVRDQLEALVLQMYRSNILYAEGVREFKKRFILTVLQENRGNQCRAARELGMHRNTLSRTIAELKIDVRQLRDGVKRPPRSARPVSMDKKIVR
jgi:DNA-binding NtrC family response regulator